MKVLVFTSLYPNNVWPNHGVFVKERMVTFAKRTGCGVTVVAPVPYYPPIKLGSRWLFSQVARHEVRDGLDVYHPRYLMTPKVGMMSYGILMYISAIRTITRLQRTFEFDVIDSHFVYPDGFAAVLLGRHFRKPVVVSARGSDISLYSRFPLIRPFLRYTLRRADRAIAVCQALKDAMVDLNVPAGKILVVPNGVDPNKFFPCQKTEARARLGLRDTTTILSVGALISLKGFDLLIKALSILIRDGGRTDLNLVIVGEGPLRRELAALVAELQLEAYVRLVGRQPHEDLYLWYSAADLFCLMSEREGWPNVLLESLACGTPVVATAVWGIPDIICSETYGLLTARNEGALARTIKLALERSWNREEIINYAKSRTWDRVAESVSDVLATTVTGASGRVFQ